MIFEICHLFVYVIVDLHSYFVQLVIILYCHYLMLECPTFGHESPFMQAPVSFLHALIIPWAVSYSLAQGISGSCCPSLSHPWYHPLYWGADLDWFIVLKRYSRVKNICIYIDQELNRPNDVSKFPYCCGSLSEPIQITALWWRWHLLEGRCLLCLQFSPPQEFLRKRKHA